MRQYSVSNRFLKGFFGINLYRTRQWPDLTNDKVKDAEALKGDWGYVGDTIRKESEKYARAQY